MSAIFGTRDLVLPPCLALRGVRQAHAHYVIADVGKISLNQNTLRFSRSATSLGDDLSDKFVAKCMPLPKSFRLNCLTPPLPLLVFAIQSDED